MSRGIHRYVVTAAAVTALAGASVVTASPAQAISGPLQTFTATATELSAVNQLWYTPLGPIINFPVTISRVVDGSDVPVASGSGFVTYQCDGAAVNTYTAVGKTLTVPCG